jgi:predicted KAP-like P-loop ATPase
MEGLLQGVASAASWIGIKFGAAAQRLKTMGKDALDAAGRALTFLLEKVPGGKEAFEMLKDFSSDTAEKIGDYIKEALSEFAGFLIEKKNDILTVVFKGASDPGVVNKIKELANKAAEDVKEKADEIMGFIKSIMSNHIKAVKMLFASRETLGKIAQKIVAIILNFNKKIRKSIASAIIGAKFFSTKPGMLVMRLMTLLSADMGGEQVIVSASRV